MTYATMLHCIAVVICVVACFVSGFITPHRTSGAIFISAGMIILAMLNLGLANLS